MASFTRSIALLSFLVSSTASCGAHDDDRAPVDVPDPTPGSDWIPGTAPVRASSHGSLPVLGPSAGPPAPPPPTQCTEVPSALTTLRLSHGGALTSVVMESLSDGRFLVVRAEVVGDESIGGIIAQVIDPEAGLVVSTERLDDSTGLASTTALTRVEGAVLLQYVKVDAAHGGSVRKRRVFSHGRWSKELISQSADTSFLGSAADGTMFFREGPKRPDEDPTLLLWTEAEGFRRWAWPMNANATLVRSKVLADGRLVTLIGDTKASIVRTRDASGVWTDSPDQRVAFGNILDDGTVVFTWTEAIGTSLVRLLTQSWSEARGSTPIVSLSSAADGLDAGSPIRAGAPVEALVERGSSLEYAAFVGRCDLADPSDCSYSPIARRFHDGAWGPVVDLSSGGPLPLGQIQISRVDSTTFITTSRGGTSQLRARVGDEFLPWIDLGEGGAFISNPIPTDHGLWLLRSRFDGTAHLEASWTDATSTGLSTTWNELGIASVGAPFVDSLGTLIVGSTFAPVAGDKPFVVRVPDRSTMARALTLQHADESSSLITWGASAPGSASALAIVRALPVTLLDGKRRLRMHVWNAAGDVELPIADPSTDTRFTTALARKCGGALLYLGISDALGTSVGVLELAIAH